VQAVRICRAAAEAHVSGRIFFLKRLFSIHRKEFFLFRFLLVLIFWREEVEEEVAEDYLGEPGYGRSSGPT